MFNLNEVLFKLTHGFVVLVSSVYIQSMWAPVLQHFSVCQNLQEEVIINNKITNKKVIVP